MIYIIIIIIALILLNIVALMETSNIKTGRKKHKQPKEDSLSLVTNYEVTNESCPKCGTKLYKDMSQSTLIYSKLKCPGCQHEMKMYIV